MTYLCQSRNDYKSAEDAVAGCLDRYYLVYVSVRHGIESGFSEIFHGREGRNGILSIVNYFDREGYDVICEVDVVPDEVRRFVRQAKDRYINAGLNSVMLVVFNGLGQPVRVRRNAATGEFFMVGYSHEG